MYSTISCLISRTLAASISSFALLFEKPNLNHCLDGGVSPDSIPAANAILASHATPFEIIRSFLLALFVASAVSPNSPIKGSW